MQQGLQMCAQSVSCKKERQPTRTSPELFEHLRSEWFCTFKRPVLFLSPAWTAKGPFWNSWNPSCVKRYDERCICFCAVRWLPGTTGPWVQSGFGMSKIDVWISTPACQSFKPLCLMSVLLHSFKRCSPTHEEDSVQSGSLPCAKKCSSVLLHAPCAGRVAAASHALSKDQAQAWPFVHRGRIAFFVRLLFWPWWKHCEKPLLEFWAQGRCWAEAQSWLAW